MEDAQEWSDDRFLKLALNGGQDEAYQLLFACSGRLRGLLTSRYLVELGGPGGVEELVHAAAWKAVETVRSYKPEKGGVRLWAWMIGVNLAIDQVRSEVARRGREKAVARLETDETLELTRAVQEAIAELPEPFRTVLLFDLRHGGRGPARELAGVLGVEVGTIYNWRRQALTLLERFFQ